MRCVFFSSRRRHARYWRDWSSDVCSSDLKVRVRTYFNGGDGRRKIGRLVEEVAEVRVRETESELHALILEAREIKRLLPRYNSAGRDDRGGWFIRLDLEEPYPVPERVPESERSEEHTSELQSRQYLVCRL